MGILKKQAKEQVIIVGCGNFGYNLAVTLLEQKKNVTVIDMDENTLNKFTPVSEIYTIVGDGTEISTLELAGSNNSDILIASTNDDNTNIMIAQIAKKVFNIKKVIARLYEPSKKVVYSNMGIETICPALLSIHEFNNVITCNERAGMPVR